MDEENTKSANKQHWDNFKLISKSVSSSASMKTKNVIIEANIDSSKITHQKLSSLTNLTKKQKRIKIHIWVKKLLNKLVVMKACLN